MVSPAAIFTAHQHQNKTERAARGGAKKKEMRRRDVQQKVEKINKLELQRKAKSTVVKLSVLGLTRKTTLYLICG